MKKRYLIYGIILIAAVSFLLYMVLGSSINYYVTVSELMDEDFAAYDTNIQVIGYVVNTSIDWNDEDLVLKFDIEEGGDNLPVVYTGVIPNGFDGGAKVLVDGKYYTDGIFRAGSILMQCPSKYEEEN